MSTKYSDTKIHEFIKTYVKSKEGELTEESDEVFTIKYPDKETPEEYTYQPTVARERKIPLITPGSLAFQQILKECQEKGVLCQILLNPKGEIDTILKEYFKDSPFSCENCDKTALGEEGVSTCVKSPSCCHQINNGKIVSVKVIKKESVRYFQFYFSATFQNKLRPKNEETIKILVDEDCNVAGTEDFDEDNILDNNAVEIQDFKGKLEPAVFDKLKTVAEEKLKAILKEKLVLFDLALSKEKKSKFRSFDKRLRRERREKVISRKHDFDIPQWRASYEALLKREEDSFITHIAVKFINLLVINTSKIRFEANLDNNSAIRSSFILGIDHACEVSCPICKKTFSKGYATQDGLYVCGNCVRQSVDTAKIYSKKASLSMDEKLNEYFEHDSGFVCSVCGKRHSRLLEFKCSHDNSSVCIHHYGLCDICGKVFSKLNLTYTEEFKRQLCPAHASKKVQTQPSVQLPTQSKAQVTTQSPEQVHTQPLMDTPAPIQVLTQSATPQSTTSTSTETLEAPKNTLKCENCQTPIETSEGKLCKATGKRLCNNCTTFTKCALCQQEYSTKSLTDNKCPACNNLKDTNDQTITLIIQNFDNSQRKTNKLLVGKNALNTVVVAKTLFSNTLFVVEDGKVVYQKPISLLNKLRGH